MLQLRSLARLALAPLLAAAAASQVHAADLVKVFVLAGQSNMQGHGYVDAHEERNGGQGSLAHLARDPATAARFKHLRIGLPSPPLRRVGSSR